MESGTSDSQSQVTSKHVRRAQIAQWNVELLPRAPYEASFTPEHPIIGYSFESQEGTHSFASDRRIKFRAKANGLAWVPAGCDVFSESEGGEYLKISCMNMQSEMGRNEQHFSDIIDAAAIRSAFALRRALLSENGIDILASESWLMTMVSSVHNVLFATNNPSHSSCWLNAHRLKMIDEVIEERLDTQLTVCELAHELEISAGFFSREFKHATGRSPYQYIVDKRLARARARLFQPKQDLSAIALDCGFSSHSHMTSQFRERFDTTPARLRNSD